MRLENLTDNNIIIKETKEISIRQHKFNVRDIISIELMDSTIRYYILIYRVDKNITRMIILSSTELENLQKFFGA